MSYLPNPQETIGRLEVLSRLTHTEDMPARRIRELAFKSLTILNAQQKQIAELEDKIRAEHAKKVRVQAFAELRLCMAEDPEKPFTKKELRKALQHSIDSFRQIAMDEVPPQEVENE